MSVQDVVSRVEQLQSLFRAAATPGGNGGSDFASQLISASAPAGTGLTAAAGTTGTLAATTAATAAASVPTGAGASLAGVPYGDEITAAAQRHGVDPALLAGLVRAESNFNAAAVSPAGAQGLTQLMPGTAAGLGVTDASDPLQALEGGARYLRQQLDAFGGDPTLALAAYNAGPGNVQKYGGVPPFAETQAYVGKVQAFAAAYRGTPATQPYSTV
jgi:soluble lytic murein transglycosylase-like protein